MSNKVVCSDCGRMLVPTAERRSFRNNEEPFVLLEHEDNGCAEGTRFVVGKDLHLLTSPELVAEYAWWGFMEIGTTTAELFRLEVFQWKLRVFLQQWRRYTQYAPDDFKVVECRVPAWTVSDSVVGGSGYFKPGWDIKKTDKFGLVTRVISNLGTVHLLCDFEVLKVITEGPLMTGSEVSAFIPQPTGGWDS